ncbi:hypothetical protein KP509_20G030300 [Ceratopteris richardii]|uniref:Uncharacterized protein n=1 Tax=Ceratopteris richardii TaxID=49495 RepID=A0A8T2SFZ5_CERRI|nr:hypothetical protein KP509_20G030300 [Ceratopteris richardii]
MMLLTEVMVKGDPRAYGDHDCGPCEVGKLHPCIFDRVVGAQLP